MEEWKKETRNGSNEGETILKQKAMQRKSRRRRSRRRRKKKRSRSRSRSMAEAAFLNPTDPSAISLFPFCPLSSPHSRTITLFLVSACTVAEASDEGN